MVKNYDNMLSRFHLILERHGQIDETDRQKELLTRDNDERDRSDPVPLS